MKRVIAAVVFFTLAMAGCTYEAQTPLPPGVSSIAIPLFSNTTLQWGVEETITRWVVEEFQLRTQLILEDENKADIILEGEVTHYVNELTSEAGSELEEYRLTIEVVARLFSMPEEEDLWTRSVREATSYSVSSGGIDIDTIQTEEEALSETSKKIAQHLLNLAVEGWEE